MAPFTFHSAVLSAPIRVDLHEPTAKIDHGTEPLILIISFSTYRASKMEAMAATVQTHITQRTILPGYFMPHTILLCSAKVG